MFTTLSAMVVAVSMTLPSASVFGATYSQELQDAYTWAHSKNITTKATIDDANMYGAITRAEMAKMLANWAKDKGETPDTSKSCTFGDTASVGGDLAVAIVEACQLGLMGQGIQNFRPYDTISRAEFGTALSRALWEDKYEGGNPYYANHLNALKSAGIMNQIANAESTKEVRGYVMLMLMRAEGDNGASETDCDDPAIALACSLESDACPAECKEDASNEKEDEDTVVKAGDLAVSAKAAEGKKALIGGVSDLDTLTFKTSEEVTISSITLERYGYSTVDQVDTVQLEDEDGNIIADAKSLNNKGQVKLTLKKDYKTVDGTFKATIVVTTKDLSLTTGNGSTIGFKVVDADSTAKNLNLDDYDPYTYDLVNYKGSAVQFSTRNSATKSYNWEAGKLYEVAKFRVKAPADAAILVKGFTLKDAHNNAIDADKYAKDVEVTVNGKEVSGLKWNINKDDELVISFSEIEVAGKETATIAVNMSFNEEFDKFNQAVTYYIEKLSNFNATDKKTETRVSEDPAYSIALLAAKLAQANGWTEYTFNGGKVKISGSKLGTVNAAANSSNVLIAQWEITITESLRWAAYIQVPTHSVAAKTYADFIDEIRLVINGEETDWKVVTNPTGLAAGTYYEFKGLEIEKSGKIEVRIDLKDNAEWTISFPASLSSSSFVLKYDESGEPVGTQVTWSIGISNVKAQAAKAEITNKSSKEVELIAWETNRKTIFDGTYTAKKWAVTLKNFVITSTAALNITPNPTFYVTIDGEEYDADFDTSATMIAKYTNGAAVGDIDDIEVADGKSVNVKVEIEVVPTSTAGTANTFNIKLEWEDEDNNTAGEADEDTVKVKVVTQGSLNINSTTKNTVLLKSDRTLAEFRIKPNKSGDDDVVLNYLDIEVTKGAATRVTNDKLKVVVDGDTVTDNTDKTTSYEYAPWITVPSEWVVVKISLKTEDADEYTLDLINVNRATTPVTAQFKKYFVPAVLSITQSKNGDSTRYTVNVDNDSDSLVSDLYFFAGNCDSTTDNADITVAFDTTAPATCGYVARKTGNLSDTENKLSAVNGDVARSITAIYYTVWGTPYTIYKDTYEDFFDAGNDDLMVYSNK